VEWQYIDISQLSFCVLALLLDVARCLVCDSVGTQVPRLSDLMRGG
jgi:hypothetical protein